MPTETIGSGGDRADIATWETNIDVSTEAAIGECLAEEFAEDVWINGNSPTVAKYIKLTSQVDAEHDGRAHDVSAAGNARIVRSNNQNTVRLFDEYTEFSWMEIKGPGNYGKIGLLVDFVSAGTMRVHHNVIHNDQASSVAANYGVRFHDADADGHCYRNIVYGFGGRGIHLNNSAAGTEGYYNTVFACNHFSGAEAGGIDCDSANATLGYNAAFENDPGTENDIITGIGTWFDNATSDATGDELTNLVTADQFQNPTTTWANTDLRIKAGADLIDVGTVVATTNNPEINVPITARGTTITGDWDIGADELVSSGVTISVTLGTIGVAGLNVEVEVGTTIASAVGTLAVAGFNVEVEAGTTITTSLGTVAVTGFNAEVEQGTTVSAGLGTISVVGFNPEVEAGTTIDATLGTVAIAGFNPTIDLGGTTVSVTLGTLAIAGFNAEVEAGTTVAVSSGALSVAGFNVEVEQGTTIDATLGVLAVAGFDVEIEQGTTIDAILGTLAVAGYSVEVEQGITVSATLGAITVAGFNVEVEQGVTIPASLGALTVAGYNVSVQLRSAAIPIPLLLQSGCYLNSL